MTISLTPGSVAHSCKLQVIATFGRASLILTTAEPHLALISADVGADMYASYRQNSYWGLVQAPPQGSIVNIVRAAKSDR